jgi:hypothetical protein
LTYLFANARYSATSRVELQATLNRGRSIDVRGIAEDLIAGRLVSSRSVDGLRYESIGGRATVEVVRRIRVYAGYARDRNNREDAATSRVLIGGYASDIGRTGFDLTASDSRIDRPGGGYHSSFLSVGRPIGRNVYVSGEYTTSLSVIRFSRSDGVMVEMRPRTRQLGGTTTVTLGRTTSLLITAERTVDDTVVEFRALAGLTLRFR